MFKRCSCADELFDSMQDAQRDFILKEDLHNDQLIYEAMQALNNAAETFEKMGCLSRAEEVTAVMVSLSESECNQSIKRSNGFDSEAMEVFRLLGFEPKDLGLIDEGY
jgi:hypothetical protein